MSYEAVFAAGLVVAVLGFLFLCLILALCFVAITILFRRYDSLYKEYEEFMADTSLYGDVDSVQDAALDLLEHCEVMRDAIDHNEEILYINFKNHIERFLFQLQVVRTNTQGKETIG